MILIISGFKWNFAFFSGPTPEELEEMRRKQEEDRLKKDETERLEKERKEAEEASER